MMKTLLLVLSLVSCASTTPQWTPQQRRALQVRSFDASYDTVFRSVRNVLQDDGYIVTNQDYEGGLILARKEIDKSSSAAWQQFFAGPGNYVSGVNFEISFALEKIAEKAVETRLTIVSGNKTTMGGNSGKEVVDPGVYRAIYNSVTVEVQRRVARGQE